MTNPAPVDNRNDASRPRLLYVSFDEFPAPKGASVHIGHFARALAGIGALTLVTPRHGRHDLEHAATPEMPYRRLEFAVDADNFLDRVMSFRDKLAGFLRGATFDAIQFRSIWEGTVACALGGRARLVYELNALASVELKYLYPGVAGRPDLLNKMRDQELSLMLSAGAIVTPSPVTAEFVARQRVRAGKVRVISNGVDAALFRPPEIDPAQSPLRLLYAGTLAPWQGLEMLYRALPALSAGHDARLTVIGHGRKQWERRHRRLIAKLGVAPRVEIAEAEPQERLAARVRESHICVAPLRANDRNIIQGCCPLKLLEYAAAGRAIVAADLPAVRAIFTDGVEALLYNPRKQSHLRRALLDLAGDPARRQRLGEAARRRVLEGFTWERSCAQLRDCYASLLQPAD